MADYKKLGRMFERLDAIKTELSIHSDWALVDVTEPPERLAFMKRHQPNLQEIEARAGGIQVTLCQFVGASNEDGLPRFYLSPDGEPGVVVEALDEDGSTVLDYVAWRLYEPEDFATAVGNVDLLGAPAIRQFSGPLHVYRTPLDWLKAGCRGCVVINPEFAGYWLRKWCRRPILVEDLDHGRELKEILKRKRETRTPLPEFNMKHILVPSDSMARAA